MEIFKNILIAVVAIAFWGIPIFLGIRIAKKKNISPHWMWFGIHPFFGWIAFGILAASKPKIICSNCGEILKAHAKVCAYCNTQFDGGTVEIKPNYYKPQKKKKPIFGILIGIGAFLLFAIFVFSIVTKAFTNSWAYTVSMETVSSNTYVINSIGEPIKQKGFIAGSIQTSGDTGTANLLIPIKGPNGKGKLNVYAKKENGAWSLKHLVFENPESTEIIKLIE